MEDQANTVEIQDRDAEAQLIAAQNDQFRQGACHIPAKSGPIEGRLVLTRGIDAEGVEFVQEAIGATASFTAFSEGADPYGLHEMGVIMVQAQKVWWKIDLYDCDYAYGSDAPADPDQTRRVLTILFPSEY